MAESKYTPEVEAILLDTIRRTGSLKTAWKAAKITKSTYYFWLHTVTPLVQKVQLALNDYRCHVDPEIIEQALKQRDSYLYGRAKQTNIYEIEKTEALTDKDGVETGDAKVTIEKKKVVSSVPTPQWVIESVIGKRLPLSDALATFAAYGYKVKPLPNGFLITDSYEGDGDEPSATTEA
ncbi:MAG: hypothetical protein KME45_03495 [Stenomitos rutilans HA7619-LM2]|jgi:hypothetical protein|nr:hypothetical protein [Stenomitos rutilans HA7619-LM2]MBW4469450.1 hypothetical protein [Stenomitos rutilans HA7619-LM2]